jgi:hypothetical protein
MTIGTSRLVTVFIGYCDDMTRTDAETIVVAFYRRKGAGFEMVLTSEDDDLGLALKILEHARDTCMSLEDIKEYFSSPHSSVFVVETETI